MNHICIIVEKNKDGNVHSKGNQSSNMELATFIAINDIAN